MSNKMQYIFVSLTLLMTQISLASSMMGVVEKSNETFDELQITGVASLSAIVVKKDLKVTGPLNLGQKSEVGEQLNVTGPVAITESKLNSGEVVGPVSIKNSQVHGKFEITGPLKAISTNFKNDLIVTSSSLKIDDCELKNLTVKKGKESAEKKAELVLSGKTLIRGDVIMEDPNMKLVKEKSVKILGKVVVMGQK